MRIIPEGRVLFHFEVQRYLAGHAWLENVALKLDEHEQPFRGRTDVLVVRPPVNTSQRRLDSDWEIYQPLEHESALFRIFGNVDVKNRDAIVDFANQYGLLCSCGSLANLERDGQGHQVEGDTIEFWRENVLGVRHWARVAELVQKNKTKQLLDYIRSLPEWADEEREGRPYSPVHSLIVQSRPILDAPPPKRLFAARECLFHGLWESEVRENLTFHVFHDTKLDRMRLRLRGEDLITAIWAQLALAVSEDKEYRSCRQCGKPFELDPDIARTNRHFCSHRCRLKAYRGRQKKAAQLHKQGKKLKAIADLLESDVSTVRGWVAAAKEKENGDKRKK